uniref:Vacuolar ATPase assembly factor VMA21 n=1 Tax=Scleropages formosus TaxID=113540 RepID=A0A8C9TQS7_SCLFO
MGGNVISTQCFWMGVIVINLAVHALCYRFTCEIIDVLCLMPVFFLSFSNDGSLVSALKTLLFFTVLMVTLPIGLYFASKSFVFEASMGMSNKDSYFYAAIVAVVAVHVVLALFVYVAWNEGSRQWREGKQD